MILRATGRVARIRVERRWHRVRMWNRSHRAIDGGFRDRRIHLFDRRGSLPWPVKHSRQIEYRAGPRPYDSLPFLDGPIEIRSRGKIKLFPDFLGDRRLALRSNGAVV